MKVHVFKKYRRIINIVGLALGEGIIAVMCIAGIVFQPETKVIVLAAIIFAILVAIVIYTIKKGNYSGKVEIERDGVKFYTPWKCVEITWEDIKHITVHEHPKFTFLGFFTNEFKHGAKAYNKEYATYWMIDLKLIDKSFIFVEYREGMLDAVREYWNGEIVNEDKIIKRKDIDEAK